MKEPGKGRRLRRLSDDEIELWLTVAATVERRAGSLVPASSQRPVPDAETVSAAPQAPPPPTPGTHKPPPLTPLAPLERRLKQKLSRGQATADAAIDLHGFRQDDAFHALRHFLYRAQGDGARVVLVVTGKGGRLGFGGESTGVLRRAVPLWLAMAEFRTLVVGFEEAGRQHGGAGALYVRLRRRDRPMA